MNHSQIIRLTHCSALVPRGLQFQYLHIVRWGGREQAGVTSQASKTWHVLIKVAHTQRLIAGLEACGRW